MKSTQVYYTDTPSENWQLLGNLDLSLDSDTVSVTNSRLTELLGPLNLSTDFLNRVLDSAQDSVMRILRPITAPTSSHVHLSIFVPNELILEQKTWGFFRIERIEDRGDTVDALDHAIDFYLYLEGRALKQI